VKVQRLVFFRVPLFSVLVFALVFAPLAGLQLPLLKGSFPGTGS
jgi:hypothetical protein